jgi:hypothetical protein
MHSAKVAGVAVAMTVVLNMSMVMGLDYIRASRIEYTDGNIKDHHPDKQKCFLTWL